MADTWQTVEQAAVSLGMSVRTVNRHISGGKIASRLHEGRREVLISLPDPEPDALRMSVREAFARLNSAAESEVPDLSVNFDEIDAVEEQDNAQPAYVSAPIEPEPEPETIHVPPAGHVSDSRGSTSHLGFDAHTVLALADNASDKAEMAVAAYQALARVAEARVDAARRSGRFAWAAVAVMAAGVTVAVGWTTHHLTQARGQADYLQQQLTVTSTTVSDVGRERDTLRTELSSAKESAARAEGRLEAATQASARFEAEAKEAKDEVKKATEAAKLPATQPTPPSSLFTRIARLWDPR